MTARDTVRRLETEGPSWSVLLAGLRHPRRFLRELVTRVMQDRTLTVAAAMSYYFFFALFPLLLISAQSPGALLSAADAGQVEQGEAHEQAHGCDADDERWPVQQGVEGDGRKVDKGGS